MNALAISNPDAGDCRSIPLGKSEDGSEVIIPWRDHEIDLGADFVLASGDRPLNPRLHVRLHGHPNAPVVVAAGGISASRKVADAGGESGWWREVANLGGAIDISKYLLLGFDFLMGGTDEAKAITPDDQARALAIALDKLGLKSIRAFVGASYGGFIGLAFAARFPDRINKLCVISAALAPHPMATALRGVQRRVIILARDAGREKEGVALARELAMTTYRTADEFRSRFSSVSLGPLAGDPYDVCEYLTARGRAYAEASSASRYLTLSDSLDRAHVDPAAVKAECLFVAAKNDRLVPVEDTEIAARAVAGRSTFVAIDSLVGHDAFLCDAPLFEGVLEQFLDGGRK